MEEDADMLIACVEDLTALIDKDGDGDISKEEFVKYAANSKFISNLLSKEVYTDTKKWTPSAINYSNLLVFLYISLELIVI